MANGRGSLECCYCTFYRCHNPAWHDYDAAYEAGKCLRHQADLPASTSTGLHRVCRDFRPTKLFTQESVVSVEERFAWFPFDLAPGVLYGFDYNAPPEVHAIASLGPSAPSTEPTQDA